MEVERIEVTDRNELKLDTEISMLKSERWKIATKIPVVVVEDHCDVKLSIIHWHSGSVVQALPAYKMEIIVSLEHRYSLFRTRSSAIAERPAQRSVSVEMLYCCWALGVTPLEFH